MVIENSQKLQKIVSRLCYLAVFLLVAALLNVPINFISKKYTFFGAKKLWSPKAKGNPTTQAHHILIYFNLVLSLLLSLHWLYSEML